MRSGTVLRVEFQRRVGDTYGETCTPITPLPPIRSTLERSLTSSVLLLAFLIPSTFGGLFNLFALSLTCARSSRQPEEKEVLRPSRESVGWSRDTAGQAQNRTTSRESFLVRAVLSEGSGSKRVP